jgi:predicted HTH transcriptional regulator
MKYAGDVLAAVVCAFLNTEGGTILVGVADNGIVKGVKLARAERDSFCREIDGILSNFQPAVNPQLYKIDFHEIQNRTGQKMKD